MAKKQKKAAAPADATQPPILASYVTDLTAIQKNATTREERRAVLAYALANDWIKADIDTLERIDQVDWHGWAMWPRA
jgi:hypothetical protein